MMTSFSYHYQRLVFGLAWWLLPLVLFAQQPEKHYYFEEEDVVFVFDLRMYTKELLGVDALKLDFADLGIQDVALTGQFNHWSKKGWKMTRRDDFTYELRKKIQDFNDAFPLDFRYIINGQYIADPDGQVIDQKHFDHNFLEDIYQVDLSVFNVSENGNTTFKLKGYTEANEVILAGTFNGWNEHSTKMNRTDDGWELRGDLPPGRYEYKFIVDGEWMHDPANKESVENEHHTRNSVLCVSAKVTFSLQGYPDAEKVILTGSFNGWKEDEIRMDRIGDAWTKSIEICGGKLTYKFIVDGKWMTDPENPVIEDDGHGNKNSVRFAH